MIKIELSEEIRNRHKGYYEQNILPNFYIKIDFKNKQLEALHKNFMCRCISDFETLAIGAPKDLCEFIRDNDSISSIYAETVQLTNEKHNYLDALNIIFGYSDFSQRSIVVHNLLTQMNFTITKNNLDKYWTPYTFVFMSGIRVCPYCNRQYITPIYVDDKNDKGKLRADLDHFFPKSKYPYLSMSLYNLVPCCKFCNSSLKNTQEFDIGDINPYEENYNDYFAFKIDLLNDLNIVIDRKIKEDKLERYLKMFKIQALYSYHKNQAEELKAKRDLYPDSYIQELYKNNASCFSSENHIKELIIGYVNDPSKISDEVLLKFRRDIAHQLGFIE